MPGIKRSHLCTRLFSVISTKQQGIAHITISADMHTDKMNCSPSQIIPFLKLFFVGHITMMEFVITGQSVNLFLNYPKKKKSPDPRESITITCHFGFAFKHDTKTIYTNTKI